MILYYDSEGKLATVLPHGSIPRQGGSLIVDVYFDKDLIADEFWEKTLLSVRYKTVDSKMFSSDNIMNRLGPKVFTKLTAGENVNKLVPGEEYQVFRIDMTYLDSGKVLNKYGDLKLAFLLRAVEDEVDGDGNTVQVDIFNPISLGQASIYIEETLGFEADSSLGMTFSEYQALMRYLNSFSNVLAAGYKINAGKGIEIIEETNENDIVTEITINQTDYEDSADENSLEITQNATGCEISYTNSNTNLTSSLAVNNSGSKLSSGSNSGESNYILNGATASEIVESDNNSYERILSASGATEKVISSNSEKVVVSKNVDGVSVSAEAFTYNGSNVVTENDTIPWATIIDICK